MRVIEPASASGSVSLPWRTRFDEVTPRVEPVTSIRCSKSSTGLRARRADTAGWRHRTWGQPPVSALSRLLAYPQASRPCGRQPKFAHGLSALPTPRLGDTSPSSDPGGMGFRPLPTCLNSGVSATTGHGRASLSLSRRRHCQFRVASHRVQIRPGRKALSGSRSCQGPRGTRTH